MSSSQLHSLVFGPRWQQIVPISFTWVLQLGSPTLVVLFSISWSKYFGSHYFKKKVRKMGEVEQLQNVQV
jgi:hypothetical protein